MKIDRRRFLASACALSAMRRMEAPLVAAELPPAPPFLGLRKFIEPGNDEFRGEKEAMETARMMEAALRSGALPGGDSVKGRSPRPASYRAVASDVDEAVYGRGESVAEGWRAWTSSLGEIVRVRVHPLPDMVRFEVVSRESGRLVQRTGAWNLKWSDGAVAELTPLFEHVCSAPRPMLEDVTGAVLGGLPSFDQQLARGVPYWRARLDPATGIDIYGSNGIAVGDIDGDGEDEVYICQPGGLPNRLYKIGPDGRWADITSQWEVDLLDDTSCALFLDLRNSGRQDLVVLRGAGPLLYLNEGTRFRMRPDAFRFARTPAGGFTGMAAADYDRDGRLDLYLCCYVYFQTEAQFTYPAPYADARNGPPNFLFHNKLDANGGGYFEDATEAAGMNENNDRFSFAPAWCDYNGDGWPDLYVANDFGRKNLYRNSGGHFRDAAAEAGVDDPGPGMSAAWFDYDGDGHPDLYVSNMWSDAGRRVVSDPAFAPGKGAGQAELYRRHTKGNTLYRNRGDGKFVETTAEQGVAMGRWAWASGGHDLDNDGRPEILVTCGMLTNRSAEDLMGFFWRQVVARSPDAARPSVAYENGWNAINQFAREDYSWNGSEPNVFLAPRGGRYYDFSGASGFDFAEDGRAFAVTDIDGDGRPDVIVKSRLGPQVRVLRNQCAGANRSIAFRLRGTESNRDAIGARVEADGQVKWVEAGSGFLSQHSKTLIFGLGARSRVERVRIQWPSGREQTLGPLDAGATYAVVEGRERVESRPFRARAEWASRDAAGDNEMRLHETWFVEPIPLPVKQNGPGLLVFSSGAGVSVPAGVAAVQVNLDKIDRATRERYEIFRKYLFDWRTELVAPLALLLDSGGRAVKIYPGVPPAETVQADMAAAGRAEVSRAFPFPGLSVRKPHRDFFKMGAAFLWYGYPDEALPYLEEVLRESPENASVVLLIGQIHLRAGRNGEAETFLQRALALKPDSAPAWNEMGGVWEARNDWRKALACYDKALAIQPAYTDAILNAAQASDKLGDEAGAEAGYRRALAVNPDSAEAANGLGLLLARRGQTAEAKRLFEQAITLRRDYGSAINNLGVLYMRLGQINDAVAAFEYGIGAAPDEDILYLNLGRVYIQSGRRDKAREVMEKLLARKPGNETALRGLRELNRQ